MAFHPVSVTIENLLKERGMWHERFEHVPVRTSEEAAAVRTGYTLAQGAKALVVRLKIPHKGKNFAMIVVTADKKFDIAKVKAATGATDVRFATEDEVLKLTGGVQSGGVPPLGNLFGLPVYADKSVFDSEKIIFNAGDRSVSIGMKSADYRTLTKPTTTQLV